MKLYISTGNSRMEKKWNGQEMEFSVFLERLSHTVRTSETMEQYRKMSKAKQDSIKDVGGFVLGKLKGGRRKKANVLFRSGLTLDMDYATEDIAEQIEMFFDFRCLIYSTHKHTPEKPRLRLIIPLSRTVSPDEYAAVARKVAEDIGMELFDDTTYEPSRLMYWPSTSADGEFFFRDIPGTFLNPDSVLERYADWRDSSSWPVSSRQKAVVSREMKKQADPLSKEGIVGAFCRTYSIEEAIRIFLPDVYQESMMPERFDYIPADSQAGVVIYEGKFAYSHHATDPACGKLLNAFDIVRMGFTVVPFGQGYKDMSPPTKELMKLTLEERIAHGGHKVLRWMMDNVYVRQDPAGNIKMDKEKSTEKIDAAVATVMALDRAIRNQGSDGSVYDARGILVF